MAENNNIHIHSRNTEAGQADDVRESRRMKDIIADATDRQLDEYASHTLSPEALIAMVNRRNAMKRRRMFKLVGIAALFVIALVGAAMVFNSLTMDVGANKTEKEEIIAEDGVAIEEGGWGSENSKEMVITEWEDLSSAKLEVKELAIPEYIPAGYSFKSLCVEFIEDNHKLCTYLFEDKNGEKIEIAQFIQKNDLITYEADERNRKIVCKKGDMYICDDEIKKATIQVNGSIIVDIWCNLNDGEIVRIIESFTI